LIYLKVYLKGVKSSKSKVLDVSSDFYWTDFGTYEIERFDENKQRTASLNDDYNIKNIEEQNFIISKI